MTDVAHQAGLSASTTPRFAAKARPFAPYAIVFAAGATGWLVGRTMGGDASLFEDKLLLLLRFMAAMKFAGVLVAAGVMHWRLTQPIAPRPALAYASALVPMAAAPGLIWSLGGIALGALLFHAGLLAFLYLAWTDDGAPLPRMLRR